VKIYGASIGNCVHVAGVYRFLHIAKKLGHEIYFGGPTVPIDTIANIIKNNEYHMIGISYRLTPKNGYILLKKLKDKIKHRKKEVKLVLGCLPGLESKAKKLGIFDKIFIGGEGKAFAMSYLKGDSSRKIKMKYRPPRSFIEMANNKMPYPIFRAHFGLPNYIQTLKGVQQISESGSLDVISLGIDQNTQEFFFKPKMRRHSLKGSGGVPVRTEAEFQRLYMASRCGNYPLMRCYSGTNNLINMASMLKRTIKNAWAAIPLCWYSSLDGRSSRPLKEAIEENQKAINWNAKKQIPVEINEAHHWSLRDAPDAVTVAMAYIAAYNAKKLGVRHYISQLMLNTPANTSFNMDLAKMLAIIEMIEEDLVSKKFQVYKQIRTGLISFPTDLFSSKGQLASSIQMGMFLKPDIIHIVCHCEALYAANPAEIVESSKLVRQVVDNCLDYNIDIQKDQDIKKRKKCLKEDARSIILSIRKLGKNVSGDPLISSNVLAKAVKTGIIDAPHLNGRKDACGAIYTGIRDGMCVSLCRENGRLLDEQERIKRIAQKSCL
jgi:hypothetical protein